MKFQPDTAEGVNVITRHDGRSVWVGTFRFEHSLLVPWSGEVRPWPAVTLSDLSAEHFEAIAEMTPEVVILGTGARLQFPSPALTRPLIERRIGVEAMDTAAACRTFNVLASEGRRVLAAVLLPRADPPEAGPAESL
jgi:uncharacterized protein